MDRSDWRQRLGAAVFSLVILGVVWWFFALHWVLVATIGGLIVVSAALPPRIGDFVSAVGWFIIAGVIYFYFIRDWRIVVVLSLIGVFYLYTAIAQVVRGQGAAANRG